MAALRHGRRLLAAVRLYVSAGGAQGSHGAAHEDVATGQSTTHNNTFPSDCSSRYRPGQKPSDVSVPPSASLQEMTAMGRQPPDPDDTDWRPRLSPESVRLYAPAVTP